MKKKCSVLFILSLLSIPILSGGCTGSVGNKAAVALSGSVVENGQLIGGSLTLVSNTVGVGVNYSAPGTNLSLGVTVPLATTTNKN